MSIDQEKYHKLAEWAENDPGFHDALSAGKAGAATEEGRREAAAMIAAAKGRPSLGSSQAEGTGRSPRRQVRLPHELNERLDSYAAAHGNTPSEVMREALERFLPAA